MSGEWWRWPLLYVTWGGPQTCLHSWHIHTQIWSLGLYSVASHLISWVNIPPSLQVALRTSPRIKKKTKHLTTFHKCFWITFHKCFFSLISFKLEQSYIKVYLDFRKEGESAKKLFKENIWSQVMKQNDRCLWAGGGGGGRVTQSRQNCEKDAEIT